MISKPLVLAICAAAALVAPPASAQTSESGGLLRDAAGKTLYTFDKDAAGESRCFDGCATAWPPFMAGETAKPSAGLTVVPRKGGGHQWAIDGKPLYYFAGDAKPGDATGDGSGGVWHVVHPATSGAGRAPAAPAAPGKY